MVWYVVLTQSTTRSATKQIGRVNCLGFTARSIAIVGRLLALERKPRLTHGGNGSRYGDSCLLFIRYNIALMRTTPRPRPSALSFSRPRSKRLSPGPNIDTGWCVAGRDSVVVSTTGITTNLGDSQQDHTTQSRAERPT